MMSLTEWAVRRHVDRQVALMAIKVGLAMMCFIVALFTRGLDSALWIGSSIWPYAYSLTGAALVYSAIVSSWRVDIAASAFMVATFVPRMIATYVLAVSEISDLEALYSSVGWLCAGAAWVLLVTSRLSRSRRGAVLAGSSALLLMMVSIWTLVRFAGTWTGNASIYLLSAATWGGLSVLAMSWPWLVHPIRHHQIKTRGGQQGERYKGSS